MRDEDAIRQQAHDLLDAAGILAPPVDLTPIIELCNARWVRDPIGIDGIGACCVRGPLKYLIRINGAVPVTRQRFSCAHELGHIVLHRFEYGILSDHERYEETPEREANAFAAELLMPDHWLRSCWQSTQSIDHLAARYRVSRQAMRIRLVNLGMLLPVLGLTQNW